ncbi:AT-rich interactive domain-containing protein 4B-like [Cajanus cajan]|uniref:AT-rich interactive domain-containing protein 4B-like n=1 Tax=Cajanus cajan TaxID=3821 RepID=UPI00098DC15A|nr:AT-rich interactive domain-containing protein 4B-like [Cajanus cajan]
MVVTGAVVTTVEGVTVVKIGDEVETPVGDVVEATAAKVEAVEEAIRTRETRKNRVTENQEPNIGASLYSWPTPKEFESRFLWPGDSPNLQGGGGAEQPTIDIEAARAEDNDNEDGEDDDDLSAEVDTKLQIVELEEESEEESEDEEDEESNLKEFF